MPARSFFSSLFFSSRLIRGLLIITGSFVLAFLLPWIFELVIILLAVLILLLIIDILLLFRLRNGIVAFRRNADRFSNGDQNKVEIELTNQYGFTAAIEVRDEVPDQFQLRDFRLLATIPAQSAQVVKYELRPVTRGEYWFGNINLIVTSPLRLAQRKIIVPASHMVMVWPAFHSLRSYELVAKSATIDAAGNRKIRKQGHSLEFEEIKEYVPGDDLRNLNWKATARKGGHLMVNNFMDERSQQVYCLVDKSRAMKMPFGGMSLLDYSINTSLVVSRVALTKYDKAGLICFDEKKGVLVPADRRKGQINIIAETLYHQQTNFLEADYERLVSLVKTRISQRSLLLLFTNFESMSALHRQLPYLRSLAKQHLLLVVFFENDDLKAQLNTDPATLEDLYINVITEKFIQEKIRMQKELQKYGITAIVTSPTKLTTHTINKYLEFKARQVI